MRIRKSQAHTSEYKLELYSQNLQLKKPIKLLVPKVRDRERVNTDNRVKRGRNSMLLFCERDEKLQDLGSFFNNFFRKVKDFFFFSDITDDKIRIVSNSVGFGRTDLEYKPLTLSQQAYDRLQNLSMSYAIFL